MPPVRIHNIIVGEFQDKTKSLTTNASENQHRQLSTGEKVQHFAHEVSIIGVRCIFDAQRNWFWKSIWILLIVCGIGLACYQIRSRIEFYYTYPTSTDIKFTDMPSMRLPQITICNENYISKKGAQTTGFEVQLQQLFSYSTVSNVTSLFDKNYTEEAWDEMYMSLTPRWSLAAVFLGVENVLSSVTMVQTNMGQCYALNAEGYNLTVTQAGSQFGAIFVVYIDQDDYLATHTPAAGVRVLMHDPLAKPLMFELGFQAGPGAYTAVGMAVDRVTQMPEPFSNCIEDVNYRQTSCIYDCQSKYMIKNCQCRMSYMSGNARICNLKDVFICVFSTFLKYTVNASCLCPPECVRVNYKYTVTHSALAETYLAQQQVYNISSAEYMRNYVTLSLFYTALTYNDVIISQAYDFMALLSDIGGALGLLLGATMLTVFEIGEFVYDLAADCVRRKLKVNEKALQNK